MRVATTNLPETNLLTKGVLPLQLPKIKQEIQKFYDDSSPYWPELWGKHIHDGYYITGKESKEEAQENLIKLLAEKANIKKGGNILDVGCGIGGSSIYLSKHFDARTTGITLSPVQVSMAKEQAYASNANSKFMVMDAESMDFSDSFDVLWILGALTHFVDQENFIKRATKFLHKGSRFAFGDWVVAEDISKEERKKYVQPVLDMMLMPNSYSINTYIEWFIKYGYRIVYAEDITDKILKTFDIALSIIKKPAVYKLAYHEGPLFINFFRAVRGLGKAMKKGKTRYGVIVAEKL